jgi:hypothetical protein
MTRSQLVATVFLIVISVGDGRNVAFFGYRSDRGRGDPADDPLTVLPRPAQPRTK